MATKSDSFSLLSAQLGDIWQKGSDKNTFHLGVIKDSTEIKSNCMRKQYRSVTSSPNQKHSVRPHPLTQHLSLLHTASLFPVCSILLLLSGKLLKSLDTASSTTSASWRRGFTALFWPGEDNTYRHWRRGDIPRIWMRIPKCQACLSRGRFVYLLSNFILTQSSLTHWAAYLRNPQFWRKGTPVIYS